MLSIVLREKWLKKGNKVMHFKGSYTEITPSLEKIMHLVLLHHIYETTLSVEYASYPLEP